MAKKQTKKETYNEAVIKIFKNPALTLDEAVKEYGEFKKKQAILKRPKDKITDFITAKVLNDYLRKDQKPPSLIEYGEAFRYILENEFERLKRKGILKVSDDYGNFYIKCEMKLKKRFEELNPTMAKIDRLVRALFSLSDSMKGDAVYSAIKKELRELEFQSDFQGGELLVRLPFIQDLFFRSLIRREKMDLL